MNWRKLESKFKISSEKSGDLLGNGRKGLLLVVSAPAGTGKTTLVQKLIEEFPEVIIPSISCTTRAPRPFEIDGKDYFFLTEEAFEARKKRGEFLEHAAVFGSQYGTLKEVVEHQRQLGKHVILTLDTKGALALKKREKATLIFLVPPSMAILRDRLERRQTESEDSLKNRLERAKYELDQIEYYDYYIVNGDLSNAYQVLRSIVIAEEHRLSLE